MKATCSANASTIRQ